MKKREPIVVILLYFITCGIYGYFWMYSTTQELKDASGRTDINPGLELILGIVTCQIFYLYTEYRNMQVIHELYSARGLAHEDKSQTVLLLNVLVFVVGFTGWIATWIFQDEFNRAVDVVAGGAQPAGVPA